MSSLGSFQRLGARVWQGTVQIKDILPRSEPEMHPEDTSVGLYPPSFVLDNVGVCLVLLIVFLQSWGLNPRPPCMLSKHDTELRISLVLQITRIVHVW